MSEPGPEILAPAGGRESLEAAVRAGCDAVYLGGKSLNARRGASNFTDDELREVVSYCHIRGVSVLLTVNTVVFQEELPELAAALELACGLGVDGVIVQDMAAVSLARRHAPELPLHASTQMSVHNLDGVKTLEQLGFTRAVLARELSLAEIARIAERSDLELEVFVHGALCMSVSGQCYISSMIGGRSGNRGLCAQPCRLPFESEGSPFALSLKDLSLVERIRELTGIGVAALKIEGRLKRPEYVAAAVRACRQAIAGLPPDMAELRAVFSRSGFTQGYLDGKLGDSMFGTRQKGDVSAAGTVLKDLAKIYAKEARRVPLEMSLTARAGEPALLEVRDGDGHAVRVEGVVPEAAINAPTTEDRARAALDKTGGTPYLLDNFRCSLDDGLILPASQLNGLRREALERMTALRGALRPHPYTEFAATPAASCNTVAGLRIRLRRAEQLDPAMLEAGTVTLPAHELAELPPELAGKMAVELPRMLFGGDDELDRQLALIRGMGVSHAVVGNLGGIRRAREHGFLLHGDFGLNITNSEALAKYAELGLTDAVLSFELTRERAIAAKGGIPSGILAYGYLPLMIFRNNPAGGGRAGALTDRLGNQFAYERIGQATELYNMTPLYVLDRLREFRDFFHVLYFTGENRSECMDILRAYRDGAATGKPKTRGLYYRDVQ